jgi:hypothetical protein
MGVLTNVLPNATVNYPLHESFAYVELSRHGTCPVNGMVWNVATSKFSNNGVRQFGMGKLLSMADRLSSFVVSVLCIIRICSHKQMLWIDTRRVIAAVTHIQALWDRTDVKFIRVPMSEMSRLLFRFEDPVRE